MDGPDPYAAPYAPPPRRRRALAPALIALGVAFLLGVALTAFAVRRWERLSELLRLRSPATVVAARPVMPPPARVPPPAAPSDPGLADRVTVMETRIDAIDARAAAARGDADRADGLLVAFAARRALDRGQPLGFLEGMLRERFGGGDAPAVALVIAAAQRPVTLAQLQDGLAALAPMLATARPDESWWTAAKTELAGLFVVRRADTPSPLPADRLSRANHALEQGQVDAAAAEVARMPGAPRAADWLAAARRYVIARAALDRLETAALLKPRADTAPAAGNAAGQAGSAWS